MTVEGLEKDLKSGNLQGLYLFHGEEQFLLENSLKRIKNLFGECIKGINFISVDENNINVLIAELETPAFGYENKLIIVRNSGIVKKDGKRKNQELIKLRDKLNNYLQDNSELLGSGIVLVIIEDEADSKHELYKTIDKLGVVCKFDFQKPIQIEKRMKAICNSYKVQIEDSTLRYFIECCGTNMQELINEIRKLIEYAGENGTIKKEDIDKLSTKKLESVIFDLTDNLGKKDTQKALEVLRNLIYAKEPLQKILITLYNHFKKIYMVQLALKNNKDVAVSLNLKPNQMFLVNKYKTQARYFKEQEIRKILDSLIDLDYNYKNGEIDLNVGLESILCAYC